MSIATSSTADESVGASWETVGTRWETTGKTVGRYGLVIALIWIGSGKYVKTDFRVFIEHSPLLSWLLHIFSVPALGYTLGSTEILAGILIGLRPVLPRLSAVGSAVAVAIFLSTISFLFTTPGVIATTVGAYPVLSGLPGQFLLKDIVLIGVAMWTLGDSLKAVGKLGQPRAGSIH